MSSHQPITALPVTGLAAVLSHLATEHGMDTGRAEAGAVLRRAARRSDGSPRRWSEQLSVAGGEVGLNLIRLTCPLQDILNDVSPRSHWITYAPQNPSGPAYVALVDRRGSRIKITDLSGETEQERWISIRQFSEMIGASDPGAATDWVTGEPSAPLDDLRSPERDGPQSYDGHPLRRLWALLRGERHDLWVVVIYSIAVGVLSLVLPVAVQSVVNTVAFGSILQPLFVLTLFVLVALGFSGLMNGFRLFVIEIIQRRIFARVAADVTHRLLRVRAEAFDRHYGPELVNRFFDVVTVQKSGALLLMDGLSLFMQTNVGMVVLALYHPLLLAFDLFLVLVMTYIIFGLGRGAIGSSIKESKAKYATAAWLEEVASHLIAFKSGGGARFATEKSDDRVRTYLLERRRHFRIVLRQVAGSLALQAIASAALLGIGGWLVIQRQLTLGQLVAAELIVTVVVGGFSKFGKKFETFYDLLAAIDKLGELIDLPLERASGEHLPPLAQPGSIRLRNVSFGYRGRPAILRNCNWELCPGERAGLVGPNGSGKSTLVDMLYGLREPNSGVVTIDDIDYRDVSLLSLREHVAVVHGPGIFSGTVFDNVSLGRESVDLAVVRKTLREVDLLDEILEMPDGLHTTLTMNGRPLSAGQGARLLIARAIAGQPRVLILDDALDRIDDVEEREHLCRMLFAADAPWTVLCVTESPQVLHHCQRVYRLVDGSLAEVIGHNSKQVPATLSN